MMKYKPYQSIKGEVADRVTKLRKIRGYKNQASFAEALGMKESNIKQREAHNVKYTIEELIKVCNLFNVDLDYLLGKEEAETHEQKDLQTITGLSSEACKNLLHYANLGKGTQGAHAMDALSWFLENKYLMLDLFWLARASRTWWREHDFPPTEENGYTPETESIEEFNRVRDDFKLFRLAKYDLLQSISAQIQEYCEKPIEKPREPFSSMSTDENEIRRDFEEYKKELRLERKRGEVKEDEK